MVRVKKRGDGRYRSSFMVNGKRYYVYADKQSELKAAEQAKREEIEKKAYTKGADLTIEEFFERYQSARESTVKENTMYIQGCRFKKIQNVCYAEGQRFGALKLSEIEPEHIRVLQRELKNTMTTKSVNLYVALVGSILNVAVNERIIAWNPCTAIKDLRRTEPKAADNIHRALTREETTAFFKAAESINAWYLRMYIVLLHTGLRIGEAAAITPLDIRDGVLHISKTVTNGREGVHIGETPKTESGNREIPLDKEAQAAIKEQIDINTDIFDNGIRQLNKTIFRTPRGSVTGTTSPRVEMTKICTAAKVERFTPHCFRHTFATRAVESGMNYKTLQTLLGHSNINMTLGLYAHVTEETKEKELLKIKFS
jgi:integrase